MIESNKIYHRDNLDLMRELPDESVNVILTDPPYLYLKNQKLDRPFDERLFFGECKRVLKKDGFIVLFGRGTSFYRWNTILADSGFAFKEEFIWDKRYCTSPLMAVSRVHETISVHTKGNGVINKVKIPYLEMKGHDIDGIVTDIKRLKTTFKNTKSLNAVLDFLENNKISYEGKYYAGLTISSDERKRVNRSLSVMNSINNGMNEKTVIRNDYDREKVLKYKCSAQKCKVGDRPTACLQSISFGLNEKTIIKQSGEHYDTIHPTQKPVRLLERLLALVSKEGDLVFDPFSGSASTAIAAYNTGRNFIACEIDKEYYDLSVERLEKAMKVPKQAELF